MTIFVDVGDDDVRAVDDRPGLDHVRAPLRAAGGADLYDQGLFAAVQRFQARHGLNTTGWVDAETAEELNVPLQWRIAQLRLNLERARRVPRELGLRYIHINIPDAHLKVVESGRTLHTARVVLGERLGRWQHLGVFGALAATALIVSNS